MNAMQYKISFPSNYDMSIIRKRVRDNATKTDGFSGLVFKAYLISDTPSKKEYAPLYLWKNPQGMNIFIFDGFYDNILHSFGWQQINIAIALEVDLHTTLSSANYLLEIEHTIPKTEQMTAPTFSLPVKEYVGKILVYNPDKWKYVECYFLPTLSEEAKNLGSIYEILHISTGA